MAKAKIKMRTPSIKKSVSARTTGRITRAAKSSVNPLYGKKGMGYLKDPEKAVKNSLYHKYTYGARDLVKTNKQVNKGTDYDFSSSRVRDGIHLYSDQEQSEGVTYKIKFSVVGTQYYDFVDEIGLLNSDYEETAGYLKENFYDGDIIYEYEFDPSKVELIPEPDNEYDPNAIAVLIDGAKVGHIKKDSASYAKELMSSPDLVRIDASIEGGRYKQLYEENGEIYIEKNEKPFYVDVFLYLKGEDDVPEQSNYIKEDIRLDLDQERPKFEFTSFTKIMCLLFSFLCLFGLIKAASRGDILLILVFLILAIISMKPIFKKKDS